VAAALRNRHSFSDERVSFSIFLRASANLARSEAASTLLRRPSNTQALRRVCDLSSVAVPFLFLFRAICSVSSDAQILIPNPAFHEQRHRTGRDEGEFGIQGGKLARRPKPSTEIPLRHEHERPQTLPPCESGEPYTPSRSTKEWQ